MTRFLTQFPVRNALIAGFAALVLALPAEANVNRSVRVADGEAASGASSVNGSVTVGSDATVTGDVSTVNGGIRVGDRSVIEDADTVNGSVKISDYVQARNLSTTNGNIQIGENATIDGYVSTTNGDITVETNTTVADDLGNTNGDIELIGGRIGGTVSTTNGDIELFDGAVVGGDIIVEKARGWNWNGMRQRPRVVIGPGCRVDGEIRLEREVRLYISESAEVGGVSGEMTMDDAEIFSGSRP